jgi:hypothetical protein
MDLESVPNYGRQSIALLRARIKHASLAILEAGGQVSAPALREKGIRGATARLISIRRDLIAAGELPPEAVREYTMRNPPAGAGRCNAVPVLPPPAPELPGSVQISESWIREYRRAWKSVRRIRRATWLDNAKEWAARLIDPKTARREHGSVR